MRNSLFVIALALVCAALPALAGPRILTVQEQAQDQPKDQSKDQAPEQGQTQPPGQAPVQAQEQAPAPAQPSAPSPSKSVEQVTPPSRAPDKPQRTESGPAQVPSRYSFQRADDGLLRLDGASGQIAFCSPRTVGWACQAVPEDRAALEKEIGRLQGEVADLQNKVVSLQAEIARLREPPPPPRPPADVTPQTDKGGSLKMPTESDVARARAAVADIWRRLMEMIANLQRDMMQKTTPPAAPRFNDSPRS